MLAIAKKNLNGKQVTLKLEDFRTLENSWKERFDLIICMTTALPHMLTKEDVAAALRSMYHRLNESGMLVIDNGITDSLLNEKPKLIPARILQDQAFFFVLEYPDQHRVIFNILQVKKTKDSFKYAFERLPYNAMRQSVLEESFARTDFQQVEYLGDYNFSPYSPEESKRLIVVTQR
jgi:glycine/sarcosine N-methyltransferase